MKHARVQIQYRIEPGCGKRTRAAQAWQQVGGSMAVHKPQHHLLSFGAGLGKSALALPDVGVLRLPFLNGAARPYNIDTRGDGYARPEKDRTSLECSRMESTTSGHTKCTHFAFMLLMDPLPCKGPRNIRQV